MFSWGQGKGQEKVVINIRVLTCPGASLVVLGVKNPLANTGDAGDTDSTLGSGRSSGGGNGSPLQYSYLKNPMDRGAWLATVHGVTKTRT